MDTLVMVWPAAPLALSVDEERDFDAFFRSTIDRVVGSLLLITRDVHAAEDATQDAYARAYQRWTRVRSLERPDLWVLRVATNLAINSWKKHKRESVLNENQGGSARDGGGDELIDQTCLEWGLDQLSPKQRSAFVLHYAQGWDVPAVAQRMGMAESTVDTHLQRARRRLRSLFASEHPR
jgi:RNA polymerase sigma-70 factor (ECF subfamily)